MTAQYTQDRNVAAARPTGSNPQRVMLVELNTDGTVGGSYFSLLFLASGLDRSRYTPIAVFASPNSLTQQFRDAGIESYELEPRAPLRTQSSILRPAFRLANFAGARLESLMLFLETMRLLRRHKVDLLHLNNSVSAGHEWMLAALVLRVPCVTHQRGLGTREAFSRTTWFFARRLAGIICISRAVRDCLSECAPTHLTLFTVHNALDPRAIQVSRQAGDVRAEFGIRPEHRVVAMVGNIQAWKGQDVVIGALTRLRDAYPNLVCLMIGAVSPYVPEDIAFHKRLQATISEQGLEGRVILTGFRDDVPNYINAAEVLIHASVQPEPFGRVLLEGMALRKPLLACRAGGVEEIVCDGETGYLYEPGNSLELASRLQMLLDNDTLRQKMGEAGFSRLQNKFDIGTNVAATEAVYRQALSGRA